MTEADLYHFIAKCKLGVLATIADSNTPQSALVGIAVTRDLEIIFDTVKTSRKYPNLISRPACSFVFGWTGEQTVQYEGDAEELQPPELERYQKVYFAAWPDGPAAELAGNRLLRCETKMDPLQRLRSESTVHT